MNDLGSKINKIIWGDSRKELNKLPDNCIDLCITSPPYWGLRDYDIEPQVWGGDENCEHQWGDDIKSVSEQWKHSVEHNRIGDYDNPRKEGCLEKIESKTNFCIKCNAWRGCLGLESHPIQYISNLMTIIKEIKRVLKKSGSFYLNLGDSYFGGGKGGADYGGKEVCPESQYGHQKIKSDGKWLVPKQLLGIPERIMITMQEDGWILRNKNIWWKKNPMPSSAKDRRNCTWEYLYFFTKSGKYWWDLDAIRVPHGKMGMSEGINKGKRFNQEASGFGERELFNNPSGKNPGDVIHLSTQAFPEAHFATFPEDLVKDPILSSCPEWICVKCGKARVRITKTDYINIQKTNNPDKLTRNTDSNWDKSQYPRCSVNTQTIGWTECSCNAEFVGGIVLDPFGGSGTTGAMAVRLNRRYIVIDIKEEYCEMAKKRIGIELEKKQQTELSFETT